MKALYVWARKLFDFFEIELNQREDTSMHLIKYVAHFHFKTIILQLSKELKYKIVNEFYVHLNLFLLIVKVE